MVRDSHADVLIVGGGLGGVAAALSALRLGRTVVLTEETNWIGGQLTAQAVPPDEHPWIEGTGCTGLYQRLRQGIRECYRRNYPLLPEARFDPHLNPGSGRVSPLCHEPRVALLVLYELMAPFLASRQLELLLRCRPVGCDCDGDRIRAVTLLHRDTGHRGEPRRMWRDPCRVLLGARLRVAAQIETAKPRAFERGTLRPEPAAPCRGAGSGVLKIINSIASEDPPQTGEHVRPAAARSSTSFASRSSWLRPTRRSCCWVRRAPGRS